MSSPQVGLILDFQGMHSVGVKKGHKIMSKGASLKIKRTQCSLKPHKQYFWPFRQENDPILHQKGKKQKGSGCGYTTTQKAPKTLIVALISVLHKNKITHLHRTINEIGGQNGISFLHNCTLYEKLTNFM